MKASYFNHESNMSSQHHPNSYEKSSSLDMELGNEKQQKMVSASRRKSAIGLAVVVVCFLYSIYNYISISPASSKWSLSTANMYTPSQMVEMPISVADKVPLEAHIMSKCPGNS